MGPPVRDCFCDTCSRVFYWDELQEAIIKMENKEDIIIHSLETARVHPADIDFFGTEERKEKEENTAIGTVTGCVVTQVKVPCPGDSINLYNVDQTNTECEEGKVTAIAEFTVEFTVDSQFLFCELKQIKQFEVVASSSTCGFFAI